MKERKKENALIAEIENPNVVISPGRATVNA